MAGRAPGALPIVFYPASCFAHASLDLRPSFRFYNGYSVRLVVVRLVSYSSLFCKIQSRGGRGNTIVRLTVIKAKTRPGIEASSMSVTVG